ncbi:hypothetical protein AVEN_154645-1 [Araneus ventricosus]|uniref:Uncharacterized protein n=1 Tax=Araneus ventricosus TaxID=182803 RepID=A0A4Y2JLJ9_ARAVE|nr:hypothetical protein AVEN_154645-1 [Araneus ventricosus]
MTRVQACHQFVMTRVQACHQFVMTRVQACHQFVMTRVQACHQFVMARVQACSKLTKASKSPWDELAASLHCKLIANYSKNRVRTEPGIELATYRLVTSGLNHWTSSATIGEDRFR